MDEELKSYLVAMEGRLESKIEKLDLKLDSKIETLDSKIEKLDLKIDSKIDSMSHLITEVKESLERELHTGLDSLRTRFDAQAVRMDRQAALIQTGSRWTARMIEWSEKVDVALDKKSEEMGDVRNRLDKLEGRNPAA